MKPPKCRSCGKEEWRHVCGPVYSPDEIKEIKAILAPIADRAAKIITSGNEAIKAIKKPRGRPRTQTPEQRQEYLKIKARARRAREKAAK